MGKEREERKAFWRKFFLLFLKKLNTKKMDQKQFAFDPSFLLVDTAV